MTNDGMLAKRIWLRTKFTDLLSSVGGLVISVFAVVRILTSFVHDFAKDQAMVTSLYG